MNEVRFFAKPAFFLTYISKILVRMGFLIKPYWFLNWGTSTTFTF